MEIQWTPGGKSYQDLNGDIIVKKFHFAKINAMEIPTLINKAEEFRCDGFVLFGDQTIKIRRTDTSRPDEPLEISYEIRDTVYLKNETVALAINIYCGTAKSIEEAINDVIVTTGNLVYLGIPIEGGKGQIKRCKEIAGDIFKKFGHYLKKYDVICVEYKTRGGKGGWMSKIAERRFYSSEFVSISPVYE